jgi:hypothetical protein
MAQNPGATGMLWAKKVGLLFSSGERGIRDNYNFVRKRLRVLRLPWLGFGLIAIFGVLGTTLRRPNSDQILVLGIIATQVASFMLIFVLGRYRMVLAACLLPFAFQALYELYSRTATRPTYIRYALTVLATCIVVYWPYKPFTPEDGYADQHKYLGDYYQERGRIKRARHHYNRALNNPWLDPKRASRQTQTVHRKIKQLDRQ